METPVNWLVRYLLVVFFGALPLLLLPVWPCNKDWNYLASELAAAFFVAFLCAVLVAARQRRSSRICKR